MKKAALLGLLAAILPLTTPSCTFEDDRSEEESTSACENTISTPVTETENSAVGVMSTLWGGDAVAQSFEVSQELNLKAVSIKLSRRIINTTLTTTTTSTTQTSEPTGRLALILDINYPARNQPADRPLAQATIAAAEVVTEGDIYTFTFDQSVALRPNNIYWLRLGADYRPNSSDFIEWHGNNTNIYAAGEALYKFGDQWTNDQIGTSRDLLFELGCSE